MSSPLPVVDVCVLTWNTAELTATALTNLASSNQGVAYRVLLRDNGSSDGTAQAARDALPDAEIDAGKDNLGFAAGINRLLARSASPYVLILNSDAWPADHALERMVIAARERDDKAVIAPRLLQPDGRSEHSTWPFPSLGLSALYATGLRRVLPHHLAEHMMLAPDWRHDRSRYVGWAVGAALLIPRAVLDRVGGLDERYFFYGEDVDWCWRATDAGYQIWFDSEAVVHHIGGASSTQRSPGAITRRKAAASALVMMRRHGRTTSTLFRLLEMATAVRIGLIGMVRRDAGTVSWARNVIAGQARPLMSQARRQ
jgi:N-acetylglucosaminyl-diphospho-decaprenol L-rhamnosyltransferase